MVADNGRSSTLTNIANAVVKTGVITEMHMHCREIGLLQRTQKIRVRSLCVVKCTQQ